MNPETFIATQVKAAWDTARHEVNEATSTRMHRALRWLIRAERCPDDDTDVELLCRWSGFNALYGQWDKAEGQATRETATWREFARRVLQLDKDNLIVKVIRKNDALIESMCASKYLNRNCWKNHTIRKHEEPDNTRETYKQWLESAEWHRIFVEILNRIYLVRCQLVHGGATWNSSVNRESVKNSNTVLRELINAVVLIIFYYGRDEDWGHICYPVLR